MRLFAILLFILLSVGCTLTKQPAAPLPIPLKPTLKSETYQLTYQTELSLPKVKSVQLPAHDVSRNQTVFIATDKASVTDKLLEQISDSLTEKHLIVSEKKNSDYILTIHQLDLNFIDDTNYVLVKPKTPYPLFDTVAKQYPTQQCATLFAKVSMRLTHTASGDVVWFAQSSIDSASFHQEPIVFKFSQEQRITNELEVVTFIHQQNTEEARLARAELTEQVKVPEYKTLSKLSNLTKVQGPCNRTEISALTPMMQYYLSSILIDKIKVQ
ncbi:hypothetical protein J8L70_00525 [Pseudoalteromonas sp. MMG010]|uniref:hypothetical protein n=1 Tax=Pseudoalteromonas sp. MMG010 TaxID=2822685 RepID=UPI001B3A0A4E|nr:hypothetical protein [Pseudoalteromonas sp. MMG010]MBQ4831720.1 hypothetical protein [Pseudoalteromonas sp. MMG010]